MRLLKNNQDTVIALLVRIFLLVGVAGMCYMLFYPLLLASKNLKRGVFEIVASCFVFIICLLMCIELMYLTFSNLYKKQRKTLFLLRLVYGSHKEFGYLEKTLTSKTTIMVAVVSYLFTIYLFAIAYLFVANFASVGFREINITFVDTFFLSLTTISVGPSGLQPISNITKILIMVELIIGMSYTIMVFSLIASLISAKNE